MGQTTIEKGQSLLSIFFIFAGYVLSVTAFMVGGNVGNQTTLWSGIAAIIAGNLVLALYAGIIGYVGMKSKRSSTEIFQPVFGIKGQVFTSTIVTLFALCFISVYSSLVGNMMTSFFPNVSPFVGLTAYIFIIGAINLKGFKGMSTLSGIAVPAIAVFVVFGLYMVGTKIGFDNLDIAIPVNPQPFVTTLSLVVACWMTGATFSADLTRFVKKPAQVFVVTIGSFICVGVLETVGLFCALGTGQSDLIAILSQLNLSLVAFFIYTLLAITSGQALVYTFSLALTNISKVIRNKSDGKFEEKFWIIPSCLFAGVIGAIMTVSGFASVFLSLLEIIGIAIPPIGGTLVANFLIVERNFEKPYINMPDYRITGFIAWALGILLARYIPIGIKPLNGFLVAVISFAAIRIIQKNTYSKTRSLTD